MSSTNTLLSSSTQTLLLPGQRQCSRNRFTLLEGQNMRKSLRCGLFLTLAIALCVASPAFAQKITGTIQGVVSDSQGAVVPNAEVTVSNTATGDVRTVTSGTQGTYAVADLPVGIYDVTVKAAN